MRAEGRVNGSKRSNDRLARALGWFSLGLGAAQVTAPRRVARAIGLEGRGAQATVMRLVGVRELAAAAGIFARPKPAGWIWARAAGDILDLALLAAADGGRRTRAATMASVVGVTAVDIVEGTRLSQVAKNVTAPTDDAVTVRKAVTVLQPANEVFAFWHDFTRLPRVMEHLEQVDVLDETRSHWVAKGPAGRSVEWDAEIVDERPDELLAWRSLPSSKVWNEGSVTFRPAPGDRGTEVVVELRYGTPAGTLGAAVAKLLGEEPATQLADDLRRFKQVLETGEIARSDASPRGPALIGHLRQRPARPMAAKEGARS